MYRLLASIILGFSIYSAHAQNIEDTFHIYFDLNVAKLNKNMEKKIDLLIYNDKIINGSDIMVIGYADYLGSEGYNKNLSLERATNIKNYLVRYGIDAVCIKLCEGKGKVERKKMTDKEGNQADRRVDIAVNNRVKRYETVVKTSGSTVLNNKNKKDTSGRKRGGPDIKELTQLKEGQTLLLKNVYFPPGSHFIKPESYSTLEKLYQILADNPNLKISIEGHVCCIHDVPDALDIDTNEPVLSLNRAKAIFNYLVKKGISEDRLQYIGFGKQHPIVAFERTEEDADRNRRVEIRVMSNKQ